MSSKTITRSLGVPWFREPLRSAFSGLDPPNNIAQATPRAREGTRSRAALIP
jgi:hypothetical protein